LGFYIVRAIFFESEGDPEDALLLELSATVASTETGQGLVEASAKRHHFEKFAHLGLRQQLLHCTVGLSKCFGVSLIELV
jgi:hypothetical protein